MTHTSTEQPSLAAIIRDLRESHARTSPGAWGKGATTHETVSRAEGLEPYKVAEFRHANDAQFCDLAHVFVPRLLSEIEALQSRVNELEAQLSAICAGGVEPLRKQAVPAALAEQEENQGQHLFDAVLNCPHSITNDAITLHFSPKQKEGHNALAQLRQRLAAYDAAAKAREMELLAVIEDLERLIPLINRGGTP